MRFTEWFSLNEANLKFGIHNGKHHTVVPNDYLRWMVQTLDDGPTSKYYRGVRNNISADDEKEIRGYLKQQPPAMKPQIKAQPKPIVQAPKMAAPIQNKWILAKFATQHQGIPIGELLAVRKNGNDWEFETLASGKKGFLPDANIKNLISSIREEGQPVTSDKIDHLIDIATKRYGLPAQNKHILGPGKLKEEQAAIDKKFQEMMSGSSQDHMMINALAGSGKTTILKHLAWKYGNPQQKWLYLVFNTKNKVEAKEKFPAFVSVQTTNGFLGNVLKENVGNIKPTDRMITLQDRAEKTRLITDGEEFHNYMNSLNIPDPENTYDRKLSSLLKAIRYEYKEEVVKFTNLMKSFAIDPRDTVNLDKKIDSVIQKYDINDGLNNVKERIQKEPRYNDMISDMIGENFLAKSYLEEMKKGIVWLLNKTMPHGTNQIHKASYTDHNLGHYRDFNDDLWYTAIHADELKWPHFDFVLADEVQDFNEPQKIMLKKLHDAGAKIVAVGDPNQAIYRFRGSDGTAFKNLGDMLQDLSSNKNVQHTLSQNFRSKPNILKFSNDTTHVKNLKQGKEFAAGDDGVVTQGDIKYDDTFSTLKNEFTTGNLKQTAFISRTNEPLVHAALNLLGSGVPFIIVGKDIAKDLLKHVDKIIRITKLQDIQSVQDLSLKLNEFMSKENSDHAGKAAKSDYLKELNEVTNALLATINQFGDGPIRKYKAWLSAKFNGLNVEENEKDYEKYKEEIEKNNPVVLTTAHRSKGLEFDRVYILRNDQFPHPKAKRPEDIEQEENARYVAYTRAMGELHIVNLNGQPGYTPKK